MMLEVAFNICTTNEQLVCSNR